MILRYAAKDAADVASAFKGLVSFDKVQTLTLIDSQVSGKFLNQIRAFLAQAAVDNEAVLFISAHGVRDANGKYHVVTFDFDPTEPVAIRYNCRRLGRYLRSSAGTELVFWELSPRLPDNCIITSDSGSAANWFARDLKILVPAS